MRIAAPRTRPRRSSRVLIQTRNPGGKLFKDAKNQTYCEVERARDSLIHDLVILSINKKIYSYVVVLATSARRTTP